MSHTMEDLRELQAKSLDEKIQLSTARIIEWYEHWEGKVYVSFSGGKDSTVLLDLVRNIYPEVPAVFFDTGLEFPELREFVSRTPNVITLKPKMNFVEVIKKFGYPVITKRISDTVRYAHPGTIRWDLLHGTNKLDNGKASWFNCEKWAYLLDADFKIGSECCNIMKKNPAKQFQTNSGMYPYIGVMTGESISRRNNWLHNGCNGFNTKDPTSTPLAFWNEQDILHYAASKNLSIAPVYGEVKEQNGIYTTTLRDRTGCVFCAYGAHSEHEPNRFQQLAVTHPRLYDYCMRGGKYDDDGRWVPDKGLGMAKVLDYIGVKWWNTDEEHDKYCNFPPNKPHE